MGHVADQNRALRPILHKGRVVGQFLIDLFSAIAGGTPAALMDTSAVAEEIVLLLADGVHCAARRGARVEHHLRANRADHARV